MFIIYDLIFIIIALIYLPVYLFKGKMRRSFWQRLGFLPKIPDLNRPIWVHAVSVGEAVSVKGLIEALRKTYPDKNLVISTVTLSGNRIVSGFAQKKELVIYLPLDLSFIISGVIRKINPELFILAETELWPNLIRCLYKRKIPVAVVNGRISDSSFGGYLAVKFFIRGMLDKINLFCMQSEVDAQRLICLGAKEDKVKVTGNVKFDAAINKPDESLIAKFRQRLNLTDRDKLLVCGSTHPGEEELILETFKKLLEEFPNLKLLIAPRHPERSKEIAKLVEQKNFLPFLLSTSNLTPNTQHRTPIFILDTIGELASFYAVADIVFMGGSFIKKGGHNILEPACYAKPIIFGPHMFNFRDIAELFLKNDAALQVQNKDELGVVIRDLLLNSAKAAGFGAKALSLIGKNQGAASRNLDSIRKLIV